MLNKAVIDLRVLRKNALAIKRHLKSGAKFNAVVKADGYGHGAEEVASALYQIVDGYSVALMEEGKRLRLSGIDKDILILTPLFDGDVKDAVHYNLTATVDDMSAIEKLQAESARQHRKTRVHIKFNAGMNRFGVDSLKDLDALIRRVLECEHLILDGMYSHFSNPQNKKSRISAQNKFLLANNLVKGYNSKVTCHIGASGGYLVGAHFDMVRIGLLLYGYKPFESQFVNLSPVLKVYAPIVKRRTLKRGDRALYGDEKSSHTKSLSLVRFGYADGLPREKVFGQFNNRCMDLTALDGDCTGWACVMDDAQILSKKYRTISYEILTKCAMRAQKIYLR